MASTTIDGIEVSPGDRRFALSVTDVLPEGALEDRVSRIVSLASSHGRLGLVCVRNDSRDPETFGAACALASKTGLGLILESRDPACIEVALASLPGKHPLIHVTDPAGASESYRLSAATGCPVAVSGGSVEDLMMNSHTAGSAGASVILCPDMPNMKGCLEVCTDLWRLGCERGFGPAMHPVMVRTWSGEYALSLATVAVMRGASLVVLDDMDPEGCDVLDALLSDI